MHTHLGHLCTVTTPLDKCEGERDEVVKAKEQAILALGKTLAKKKASNGILTFCHVVMSVVR